MILKILDEVYQQEQAELKETAKKATGWRSSSLGSCLRGQFLSRLLSGDFKVQHDRRTMDVFELGNITEDIKIAKLKKHPKYLVITQGEMSYPKMNITGHFDALVIDLETNKPFLFECKSKNSRAFTYMDKKKEGAMRHHMAQNQSYQYMINEAGFCLCEEELLENPACKDREYANAVLAWLKQNASFEDWVERKDKDGKPTGSYKQRWILNQKIEEGSILYVSKDDQRTLEYPVFANDVTLAHEWQTELMKLNYAWENQEVLPENASGTWQSKYCQYCQAGLCEKLNTKEKVVSLMQEVAEQEALKFSTPY